MTTALHERRPFAVLASPAVCQALAVVMMFFALAGNAIRDLMGWPGQVTLLAALVLLAVGSLVGQAPRLEWRGALPFTLIAVLAWLTLSAAWSQYPAESVESALYALGYAALGLFLALGRDVIQAIRALGDALRAFLAVSLALEVFSGLVLRTPVNWLGVAGDIASALRRVPPQRRPLAQWLLGAVLVAGLAAAFLLRQQLLNLLGANHDLALRVELWRTILPFVGQHQVEGWGWIGAWNYDTFPFSYLAQSGVAPVDSALNAGIDAYLQLGIVGAVLLAAATGLALMRAWLLGTDYPSTAYAWPVLVLVLIGVTNLAQSYLLFEGCLMLFVYCSIAVARKRSWRRRG